MKKTDYMKSVRLAAKIDGISEALHWLRKLPIEQAIAEIQVRHIRLLDQLKELLPRATPDNCPNHGGPL